MKPNALNPMQKRRADAALAYLAQNGVKVESWEFFTWPDHAAYQGAAISRAQAVIECKGKMGGKSARYVVVIGDYLQGGHTKVSLLNPEV